MEPVLYNSIGTGYNNKRTADHYLAERLYENVVSGSKGIYLDIGCGTGNYTIALQNKGLEMWGIDPSSKMLETATAKSDTCQWALGRAENIPVVDNFFEGITGILTLHHWKNFTAAFKELYRVLKPGGKMVFFSSTPQQMENYWLNHYFRAMLQDSIEQMPSYETIAAAAGKAGFTMLPAETYSIQDNLQDHFLYVGKNRPELYFDDAVRSGISSFASLANAKEVAEGLAQLRTDIDNRTFEDIRARYNDAGGDYIFIKAIKE